MSSLSEVCKLIVDCPHSTARNEGEGYPLIRTPNIGKGRFNLENVHRVSEEIYNIRNTRAVPQDDDLILAREAPAGNVAIIKNGDKFCLGQRTVLIRPDKGKVNPDFLVYYLLGPEQQNKLLSQANGSTVDHVNLPIIRNLQLSLPPLPVQQRIASILSAYDDLIENNQKHIKLVEEAAQRLYKEWFVDLRFPGHEGVKIVDGVPEGWNKVRLDEVTSVLKRGISPKYDENGEFTVINQKCIRKNIVDYSESRKQSKKYAEELQLQESDTVICSTGIGTLGRVGQIYNVYQNSTFDSHVTLVRANKLIAKQFLFWSLKLLQPYLMSLGKGSTNQQELYKSDLTACFLLLPEEYIMNAFERQAQELHDIIAVKTKQISSLREARDRLLPKLMSGEIEV